MTPKQLMVADGAPKALFMAPEARRKAWDGVTIRSIPFAQIKVTRDESPETAAFRAAEEERRRQKSLAGIQRMKNRFAAKAVDFSKMRWDPRRNKFVEDVARSPVPATKSAPAVQSSPCKTKPAALSIRKATDAGAGTLTKDNAEKIARLNGVWKDGYEKLRGTGRIVMTVGNVLKGIAKRGGTVKWQ